MLAAISASARAPLSLVDLPRRPLRPGEVRVKVKAIGVNPVDWKMRDGSILGLAQRLLGPPGPMVVGLDFAGEVIEVTPGASIPVGARIVGGTDFSRKQRGSYAEEVNVEPGQCAVLPDGVSFEDAACLPVPGATAWQALEDFGEIRAKPGAKVLVLGASGGVGLVAVQLAGVLGAKAYGVCSGKNAALVSSLGATVFDYTEGDPLERARAEAPFDVVLNAVGSATYSSATCRSLLAPRRRATLALVVVTARDALSLVFSRRTRSVLGRPRREVLEALVQAVARGAIKPVVAERLPLAEAERAHALSRAGKVVGKILLLPP